MLMASVAQRRGCLAGLAAATGWFEVPVDGFAGHAEGFCDLGDGVLTSAVVAFLLVLPRATSACRAVSLGLRPPARPRARADSRPSRVPSEMRSASISSIAARTWR